ncbi:MAG: hypothetical protein P8Z30_17640 [Acidobacteriota bacterium]
MGTVVRSMFRHSNLMKPGSASFEPVPCMQTGRVLLMFAVFAAAVTLAAPPAYCWGGSAHRLADDWAIGTLPSGLGDFFRTNRSFILAHANDPEEWMKKDRYERMRHYIFLNKYGMFPYLELPHAYRAAVKKYGPGHIKHNGVLPWQVGEYSLKLTNDFRKRDWEHVRQLTGPTGLERRFGSDLVERYSHFFMFRPDNASKISDPTEHAFQMVLEAHTWVDQIILADLRALAGQPGYTDEYYDRFYSRVGSTAMKEISESAHDIGSYWYTAWVNAGRPELPGNNNNH